MEYSGGPFQSQAATFEAQGASPPLSKSKGPKPPAHAILFLYYFLRRCQASRTLHLSQ